MQEALQTENNKKRSLQIGVRIFSKHLLLSTMIQNKTNTVCDFFNARPVNRKQIRLQVCNVYFDNRKPHKNFFIFK